MPLLILGLVVSICVLAYIYITSNEEKFVREKTPPPDPLNIIYLPADLDAEKNKEQNS